MNDTQRKGQAAIQSKDLNVKLAGNQILGGLSFEIAKESRTVIVGPNGSGKTTLLRAMGGLIPYQGSLSLNGRDVRDWTVKEMARQLAFVRQQQSLAFDFTVDDLVKLGRAPHKSWLQPFTETDRHIVHNALNRVDLTDFAERSALTLSGGELQRVFLAQALVQDAEILLLDEPTTHLDVFYQFAFMDRVKALSEEGRTVVAVIHDLNLAARYAEHILVLDQGKMIAHGTPAEVLTEELLASVFRMDASLTIDSSGQLTVQYRGPVTAEPTTTS